jgi:hypothetical protein
VMIRCIYDPEIDDGLQGKEYKQADRLQVMKGLV